MARRSEPRATPLSGLLGAGAAGATARRGPPWILGQGGSPLEAPENTLPSLARALEWGLDGVSCDVRSTRDRELVLLADETLERSTDGHGRVAERRWVELAGLDAGVAFHARFRGTRLALLDEALAPLVAHEEGARRRWVVVHERGLAPALAAAARRAGIGAGLCIVSEIHDVCLEARAAGLEACLAADAARAKDALFLRENGIGAAALPVREWPRAAQLGFACQRAALGVDDPAVLLEALRAPLDLVATREPLRALALRTLVHLAPDDRGPHPLELEPLELAPTGLPSPRGDWFASWESQARVRNPLPFAVEVTAGILPRHGAYELGGVPVAFELEPGAGRAVPFTLSGGARVPGLDPCFFALLRWRRARGRAAGRLFLDAPLRRVRRAVADAVATRLVLLSEGPRDARATMLVRRRGRYLFVSLESGVPGIDVRSVVHMDGRLFFGARGVRVALPEDFDARRRGVPFSCGVTWLEAGERRVRRWAGGVPDALGCGSPGLLFPSARA